MSDVEFFTIFIHCVFHFSCNAHASKMSHLPRPTSAASTSSSSGIGTLPGGPSSKIPKPGFSRENSSLTKDDVTSRIPKIPKPGFSRENSTLNKSGEDFKVGDKVSNSFIIFQGEVTSFTTNCFYLHCSSILGPQFVVAKCIDFFPVLKHSELKYLEIVTYLQKSHT